MATEAATITERNPQRLAVLLAMQKLLAENRYGTITLSVPSHDWKLGKMRKTVEVVEDLTLLAGGVKR